MSVKQYLFEKAPLIAAGAAIGGVVSVAYFAAKDTLKAKEVYDREVIRALKDETDLPTKPVEVAKCVWRSYIPTAIAIGVSVSSIVALNYFGERRTMAAASAAALAEAAFHNYRTKVVERLGNDEESVVYKESKASTLMESRDIVIVGGDDVLIQDEWSGRFFKSDVGTIREAVNDTNAEVFRSVYASLTDFYDRLGLDPTGDSDEVGWNTDNLLAVSFEPIMAANNKPALLMSYDARPFGGFSTLRP